MRAAIPGGEFDALPARVASARSSESGEKLDRYWTVGRSPHRGPDHEKRPCFQDLSLIAGAGFGHLSPTGAYRFVELIRLQ